MVPTTVLLVALHFYIISFSVALGSVETACDRSPFVLGVRRVTVRRATNGSIDINIRRNQPTFI
jgi:hypothetical protein